MTTFAASVTIVDLPAGTTVTGAELFEAVQTSNGVGQSVQLTLSQMLSLNSFPAGGATGTLLYKTSGQNYSTSFAAINTFVSVGTSLATSGSATAIVISVATAGIGSTQLGAFAVQAGNVATGAIGSTQLGSFAVVAGSIATGAVGSTQLGALAVQQSNITSGAVGSTQLGALAVQQSNITSGAVGSTQLGQFAVQAANIATSAVANIAVTSVTGGFGVNANVSTTGQVSIATTNPPYGFDAAVNLQLNITTAATNLLSVAVKANNGSDPTAANPVLIPFRSSSVTSGAPVWAAVTSALSINTVLGASFGAATSIPFRLWVVAFYNGGSPILGLINCCNITSGTTGGQIFPLNAAIATSSSQMVSTSTSPGVFYTPNGTTVTNSSFSILGYCEYNAGLASPGTYTTAPTAVQLFGPGVKKPGDIIQEVQFLTSTSYSTISTTFTPSTLTTSFTLQGGTMNVVRVEALGVVATQAPNAACYVTLRRGTASNIGATAQASGGASITSPVSLLAMDAPGTASATTYAAYVASNTTNSTVFCPISSFANPIGSLTLKEIMV